MIPGKPINEFVADLNSFAKAIDTTFALAFKKVVLEAFTRIVMRSPVDTGRFRSSWTIQEGEPDESVKPEGQYDVAKPGGLHPLFEGPVLANIDLTSPYVIVWINNSLPYAEPLEFGHSKQAPAGMVRLTAAEIEQFIGNALKMVSS